MLIHETNNWILKHREDSKLPGYLILAAKTSSSESLSGLSYDSVNELGLLQTQATRYLELYLDAKLVYICRWGHQPGNQPHFHIVPLYEWVKKLYLEDPFWVEFEANPDGPIYFTYITRAFIEYDTSPSIEGPSINESINVLREAFALNNHREIQS
jgi:diadenosine tetraphosphate (Ap4A) HIT family hydrolase